MKGYNAGNEFWPACSSGGVALEYDQSGISSHANAVLHVTGDHQSNHAAAAAAAAAAASQYAVFNGRAPPNWLEDQYDPSKNRSNPYGLIFTIDFFNTLLDLTFSNILFLRQIPSPDYRRQKSE